MQDLGLALEAKVEFVVEDWIRAVSQDPNIETAHGLAYQAVRNSLPEVLRELSYLLSKYQVGSVESLEHKSLHHGFVRSQQGYDTAEIVREYRVLRQIVLKTLEPELLEGSPREIINAMQIINSVLDQVITDSLESYINTRLEELKQMQGQLALTNQELVRLLRTQKENVAFMAHELKTPLNSIIGHSSLLLKKQRKRLKEKDTITNLDQLERVLRNGRRLLKIINDTLELSQYDQGTIQLDVEEVQLEQLVKEIVGDGLEPLAHEKNLTLEMEFSQAPDTVMTDSFKLQQVIINLVSNAIRYTDAGKVRVACWIVDDMNWCIAVSDTGVGIPSESLSTIFEPYQKAGSRQPNDGSTGLGLAILQRIVSLMLGTIDIESEVNQGTTITVRLPLVYD